MNITKLTTTLAALAAAFVGATSAHGQAASGDLIIGFQQSGNNDNYQVDLGPASLFLTPTTTTQTFSLSSSDLSTDFGTSWATVTTQTGPPATKAVQWGIVGANDTGGTLALGTSSLANNTFFVSWNTWDAKPKEGSTNNEAGTIQDISNLYNDITGGNLAATTSNTSTDDNDFASSIADSNFEIGSGFANSPLDNNATGTFIAADAAVLNLYELTPTDAGSLNKPTTLLGSFALAQSGVLTFTAVAAPEPSTFALLAIGGLVLLVYRHRSTSSVI